MANKPLGRWGETFLGCLALSLVLSHSAECWAAGSAKPPHSSPGIHGSKIKPEPEAKHELPNERQRQAESARDSKSESTADTSLDYKYFHFSDKDKSLDTRHHPEHTYYLSGGTTFTGQTVKVKGKTLVIKTDGASDLLERIAHILEQPISSTVTAVSLLHLTADAATNRKVKEAWGAKNFETLESLEHLDDLLKERNGERVLFFGHIESTAEGSGKYVTLDRDNKPTFEISLQAIKELAKKHKVEVVFLGCKTFSAGASAGVLRAIASEALPQIVKEIKAAKNRAELYSTFSVSGNPTFIDPHKLIDELSRDHEEVHRVKDSVPIALYQQSPGANTSGSPPPSLDEFEFDGRSGGIIPHESKSESEPFPLTLWELLLLVWAMVLTYFFLQIGFLFPFYEIIKYQNYRYGRFPRLRRILRKIIPKRDVEREKGELVALFIIFFAFAGPGLLLQVLFGESTIFDPMVQIILGLLLTGFPILFVIGAIFEVRNKEYE